MENRQSKCVQPPSPQFPLHVKGHFIGFILIYWTPEYFLKGSILEKCGKILKKSCFSRGLRPDWSDTAQAATARLGSIGLENKCDKVSFKCLA